MIKKVHRFSISEIEKMLVAKIGVTDGANYKTKQVYKLQLNVNGDEEKVLDSIEIIVHKP